MFSISWLISTKSILKDSKTDPSKLFTSSKPVEFWTSPKTIKNETLKIVHLFAKWLSNRFSFEDPQNRPKTGPSRSFTSPRNDFQTGPVLKIPKINQKWDPQDRSPHPEMTFKLVQFWRSPKRSPKQSFSKFYHAAYAWPQSISPLVIFRNQRTNDNNRSRTNIISEVAYTIAPFGGKKHLLKPSETTVSPKASSHKPFESEHTVIYPGSSEIIMETSQHPPP